MIPPALADSLAVYRLTRLVTEDTLLNWPREVVIGNAYRWAGRAHDANDLAREHDINLAAQDGFASLVEVDSYPPKLATLITCRYCAGMWVALSVVLTRRYAPRMWGPLADALAMSAGAALLARLED